MTNTITTVIEYTTTVDRPQLRGPSFRPVAANTKIVTRLTSTSRNEALRVVQGLMDGEEDFGSEFVSRVQAYSLKANGLPGRQVRKMHVRRGRTESWELVS